MVKLTELALFSVLMLPIKVELFVKEMSDVLVLSQTMFPVRCSPFAVKVTLPELTVFRILPVLAFIVASSLTLIEPVAPVI